MNAESRFILSQGFTDAAPESCGLHFAALQFQPRVIGIILVAGMILQSVGSLPSVALFVMARHRSLLGRSATSRTTRVEMRRYCEVDAHVIPDSTLSARRAVRES